MRQEIIILFWPTLEKPQLDQCGSIRKNIDKLGRPKCAARMMKGFKTMTYRQRLKKQRLFCLIKETLKELKIGAFRYVKRAILSYSLGKVEDKTKLPLQQEKCG